MFVIALLRSLVYFGTLSFIGNAHKSCTLGCIKFTC